MADMAISVHEGLAIGIFCIECWGMYNCFKSGEKNFAYNNVLKS